MIRVKTVNIVDEVSQETVLFWTEPCLSVVDVIQQDIISIKLTV